MSSLSNWIPEAFVISGAWRMRTIRDTGITSRVKPNAESTCARVSAGSRAEERTGTMVSNNGGAIRTSTVEKFSARSMVDRYEALYREVLSGATTSRRS